MSAINEQAIKSVVQYRKKGLSFREIARLLEADLRQVYRWYEYHNKRVDTYPQKQRKKVLTVK